MYRPAFVLVNQRWEEPVPTAKPFSISKRMVWEASKRVKANQGMAGVDEESLDDFEAHLTDNLYKLWNRLASGSYFPPPVRTVMIPKRDGGQRALGIPTVSDRIAQTVVAMVLEPVLEPHFHPDSYGYRPGKSAIQALGVAFSSSEIGASSAPLLSASFFIGARCRPYNDDYMQCKTDNPGKGEFECLKEGRRVTRCARSVYVEVLLSWTERSVRRSMTY